MNRTLLLAGACAFAASVALAPAAKAQPAPVAPASPASPQQLAAATDPGYWGTSGIQTEWMDPATRPGDDFNRHVNGKWLDSFEIPADKTRYGAFDQLAVISENRLRLIIDELAAKRPAAATPEGRVLAAYTAFMDEAGIERAGLAPARPWLDRIAAVKTSDELWTLFAAPGIPSPITLGVGPDPRQADRYALAVGLGGLGLPDRDYYLSDNPRFAAIRERYKEYLAFLLTEAGHADAGAMADRVYALEAALAANTWDRTVRRNRDLTYHKLTMADLDALPNGAGLARMVRATGPGAAAAPTVLVAEMPLTPAEITLSRLSSAELKAKVGGGLPAHAALVGSQPVEVWKAWATARFLSDHAAYLPKRFDDATFAMYNKLLMGQPVQRARWKRALRVVEGQLGDLLGRLYAQRYFPPENKAAMTELVANLRKAMAANLATLKWMGPQTRREAEAKLAAFTPKIGTPDVWKDYAGLTINPATPLANAIAAGDWQGRYDDVRIGQRVDRSEWHMQPHTVNAYYNPPLNEIVFPAAILQPPFFNLAADPAVNYGAIGAVIGHEMGHGFDDQGAKSDGTGNLRDWWTPADKANFLALTDRLVAQFDALCPFDSGKTCVNGRLTLGENIGDLGGLSLAYRAYRLSLKGKPAPVVDGLSGDQRFFMAYAQVWRSKYREEAARQQLLVDPHSPPQYRVNGIVRNFDEWYKAFKVKPGDKLYLPPAERLRIW